MNVDHSDTQQTTGLSLRPRMQAWVPDMPETVQVGTDSGRFELSVQALRKPRLPLRDSARA